MALIIILWFIALVLQSYNYFIKESMNYAVSKGDSAQNGIPLMLWDKNKFMLFKIVAFLSFAIPLIMTYVKYGFWIGIIVGTIILMISFGLGKGRVIFLSSKYN